MLRAMIAMMGRLLRSASVTVPGNSMPRRAPQFGAPQFGAPQATARPAAVEPLPEEVGSLRVVAFYAALAMLYARFAILPEIMSVLTGANTYLLYLVGPPAILGCLITGGFGLALRSKAVLYWSGFFVCMLAATPFSSWVGASAQKDFAYARTDLICLYVVAGLVLTWKEVVKVTTMMAFAALTVIGVSRIFATADSNGRLSLDFEGIISNSNDLASHLVLLLPFILLFMIKPGRNIILRFLMAGCIFYGLWVILGTSSRGAMLGLFGMSAVFFFRLSGKQRIGVMVGLPVIAIVLIAVLPKANLARLGTIFGGAAEATASGDDEAGDSMASRQYLFRESLKYTLEHPLFGVGPSQFSNFEGITAKANGEHGNWHETHNTYTQISSECGIPAFLFAMAALVYTVTSVNKTYNAAKRCGDHEVARVSLCFLASMIGYMVTIAFLPFAYRFTLPAMIGLGVAISRAADRRMLPVAAR